MYYFIVNPLSRSGKGRTVWDKVKKRLNQSSVKHEAYFTKDQGDGEKLAYQIAKLNLPCTLAVIGGDGTLNEVVNGLTKTDFSHITLGYIPTGSGNDFGRGLELSDNPEKALESILHPSKIINMDVGIAQCGREKRYFLISSGIGFDASICHEALNSGIKKFLNRLGLGRLTYAVIAIKQLFLYHPCSVVVRIDRQEVFHLPRYFLIAAMNLKYEGGGCMFCPDADYNDGKIDICIAGRLSKLKILFLFPTAFWGKHIYLKGVHIKKGHLIEIISSRPLPIHCDGESFGCHSRLVITTANQKISVIAVKKE